MSWSNHVAVEPATVADVRPHDQLLIRDGLGHPRLISCVRVEPMRNPVGHLMLWCTQGFTLQAAPDVTVNLIR